MRGQSELLISANEGERNMDCVAVLTIGTDWLIYSVLENIEKIGARSHSKQLFHISRTHAAKLQASTGRTKVSVVVAFQRWWQVTCCYDLAFCWVMLTGKYKKMI